MENNVSAMLMKILGCALCGTECDPVLFSSLSAEMIGKLYTLSKAHDLAHAVYDVLEGQACMEDSEIASKFKKQKAIATYRYAGIQCELESVYALLEKARIPYMPLKGSVIRDYYPNPEMRTSSDIDILIHENDLEHAVALFRDELSYSVGLKSTHDISLFSPGGIHVELHFSLSENDPTLDAVLLTAWDLARVEEGYSYRFRMSNEMFFVYCLSHMAKHFVGGGCGIRPFMDLWIIEHKMGYDSKKAAELLSRCRLTKFAQQAEELTKVWFAGGEHSALTGEMEEYILGGGVFGKTENKIAIASTKQGGRLRYALGRIFLSFDILKLYYPNLEKHPVLYPCYLVKRWFRVLFGKNRKNAIEELKKTATVEGAKKKKLSALCKNLELI